jgi:hypothetical protein
MRDGRMSSFLQLGGEPLAHSRGGAPPTRSRTAIRMADWRLWLHSTADLPGSPSSPPTAPSDSPCSAPTGIIGQRDLYLRGHCADPREVGAVPPVALRLVVTRRYRSRLLNYTAHSPEDSQRNRKYGSARLEQTVSKGLLQYRSARLRAVIQRASCRWSPGYSPTHDRPDCMFMQRRPQDERPHLRNRGRCEILNLCAGLYVTNGRSDQQLSIVTRMGCA